MRVRGVQVYPLSRLFLRGCAHPSVRCQVLLRREYPPPLPSLLVDNDIPVSFQGRWKSPQMPAHYARAQEAERGAIARGKEKGGGLFPA